MTIASKTDTHKGIVYLDPTDLSKTCNASNSVSTTGTKEGCMKWYIFDDSGNNYTMILDHNTTALVIYNSTKSNSEMKEAAIALSNDTANWNSSLNARLITANEIAKITGNTSFSGATSTSSNWFYLDSNNQTRTATSKGTSKYAWLFDYTNKCASYGCNIDDSSNNGYWTSTPVADSSSYAWTVYWNGSLNIYYVSSNGFGIRPVITISKSVIS